jgi:hypothetical protein
MGTVYQQNHEMMKLIIENNQKLMDINDRNQILIAELVKK